LQALEEILGHSACGDRSGGLGLDDGSEASEEAGDSHAAMQPWSLPLAHQGFPYIDFSLPQVVSLIAVAPQPWPERSNEPTVQAIWMLTGRQESCRLRL
jgi:hypothetical protein